jgi:hypothetical protein
MKGRRGGNNLSLSGGRNFYDKERAKLLRGTQAEAAINTPLGQNIELAKQLADQQEFSDELVFDDTLETPVESLQDDMVIPPTAGPPQGSETFVSPDISTLERADLSPFTEVKLNEEQIEEARGAKLPVYIQRDMYPGPTDVASRTSPEQGVQALEDTLIQESMNARAIISTEAGTEEFTTEVDKEIDNFLISETKEASPAEGYQSVTSLVNLGRRAFDTNDPGNSIFDVAIDWSNAEGFDTRLETDPQGLIQENANAFNQVIKRYDKLNMLINPKDPNSAIRPEFGAAAMLSYILLMSEATLNQAKETDKEAKDRAYDNAMDRATIGPKLSKMVERMLYPTKMDDPKKMFQGVTSDYGYNSRLTADEHNLLGQYIVQGFTDARWNNFVTSQTVTTDGKKKAIFLTTRAGEKRLHQMRRGIRNQLGLGQYKSKPVSGFPTLDGRFRGEAAYTQRKNTRSPLPNNERSEIVQQGINAMVNTAYTVPEINALLYSGMLTASLQQPLGQRQGIFSEITKTSEKYYQAKATELYKGYMKKYRAGKLRAEELGTFINNFGQEAYYGSSSMVPTRDGSGFEAPPTVKNDPVKQEELRQIQGFQQAAKDKARAIQAAHIENARELLSDGINRTNQRFYYAYTTINNSSRMMIANDELNPHQDKEARFLVSGLKPVIIKKTVSKEKGIGTLIDRAISKLKNNGTKIPGEKGYKKYTTEENFITIMARTLVPGAGTGVLSDPIEQLTALKELLKPDENGRINILGFGKELVEYTTANQGYIERAKQRLATNQPTPKEDAPKPLSISSGLSEFLEQHEPNDTFFYALESLHELYRYAKADTGSYF